MRTYTDPVTGDTLTAGERAAWAAQSAFRRWSVIGFLQLVAIVWLVLGARDWWNYAWSDLAVIVESVTMLALFNQTRRDAVKIRSLERIERQNADQLEHLCALMDHHGVEKPETTS